MVKWTEKELADFTALISREKEALNEFEHLMRLVRDQSESLDNIQPRIQELLKTVSETASQLQKYLQAGSRKVEGGPEIPPASRHIPRPVHPGTRRPARSSVSGASLLRVHRNAEEGACRRKSDRKGSGVPEVVDLESLEEGLHRRGGRFPGPEGLPEGGLVGPVGEGEMEDADVHRAPVVGLDHFERAAAESARPAGAGPGTGRAPDPSRPEARPCPHAARAPASPPAPARLPSLPAGLPGTRPPSRTGESA